MLNYKDILVRSYVLHQSGSQIARELNCSKSGVNDFLKAFRESEKITYPVPENITNEGIAVLVYGTLPGSGGRDTSYVLPDYKEVHEAMNRKNMTLMYLWNRYRKACEAQNQKYYQYRRFCELYALWLEENNMTIHIEHCIGQKMEVDFAGKTFTITDPYTGEVSPVVVFVAVLPYSQYIYAEGMISIKEQQWIAVNNHALEYFGGVPAIVVCDNCKQAVLSNRDWIEPELNKDYAEWAEHNHTAILPAKVRRPKFKSSVENAVGILEKGIFHDMEEQKYFSLDEFNEDLWFHLKELNNRRLANDEHSRAYYWEEERKELMPLPPVQYQYTERKVAKVSSDFHVRFDNAYYSVPKVYLHKSVTIAATESTVKIYSQIGEMIAEWPRAARKGQWQTDPKHLPVNFLGTTEWNSEYFLSRAVTIGPNTVEVIKAILSSKKLEVQTYRLCIGVLNLADKYSRIVLESTCKQAVEDHKPSYSYIKNIIASVAEEDKTTAYNSRINEERNQSAYVIPDKLSDLDTLLLKSERLIVEEQGDGNDKQ